MPRAAGGKNASGGRKKLNASGVSYCKAEQTATFLAAARPAVLICTNAEGKVRKDSKKKGCLVFTQYSVKAG